jgi:hypothetical protein
MTLSEFLLARIAEDEAEWTLAGPDDGWHFEHTWQDKAMSARVLAQCAAYRTIVELHAPDRDWQKPPCSTCAAWAEMEPYEAPPWVWWPCPTLRALASVYADHPEFEEGWAL